MGSLLFNFDGTIRSGLGDTRRGRIGPTLRFRSGPATALGRVRSGAARHAPPVNTLRPKPMRTAGRIFTVAAGAAAAFACSGLRAPTSAPKLEFASEPPAAPGPGPTQSGGAPEADWWTSFGVPELDRVVERALARNLTLERAAARLAQAAAEAGLARGALFPQVEAGATRLAERRNFIGLPIPGLAEGEVLTADYVAYGLSLDLSWEANLWRAATPRARAARAGFEAAVAEVAGARVSLAGQAARLYFLAVEARQQARLAEAAAANREQTARWMRDRARIGEAALAAADAAEARAAEAQAAAASRREAAAAAIRALEVLFAEYPDGVPGPGWTLAAGLPRGPGAGSGGRSGRPDRAPSRCRGRGAPPRGVAGVHRDCPAGAVPAVPAHHFPSALPPPGCGSW